jgi:predicted AlkP superfamily phosphohydrolase/phosphomutase
VAWSSFSTATNPGKHNIYDFISRNPADYKPVQSSVRVHESRRSLGLGRFRIPLGRARVNGLRKSKPFWTVLGESGVFSAVLRVPITFPPDRFAGVQLAAMCVPDLRGTHGTFIYFTETGGAGSTTDGHVGGEMIRVERRNGTVRSSLPGPRNTLRSDHPDLHVPFRVTDDGEGAATLHIDGQKIALREGRYTDWVRVTYRPAPGIKVHGVCRFLPKRLAHPFEMYCTPIQIDPRRPVMPISHPRVFSTYLACLMGSYATLGFAEDTWALSEGRLDEAAFLTQAYDIHEERERMFFDALKRVHRGTVVCVFDGPDRIQHMFWRFIDEEHPAHNGDAAANREVIDKMYERMDGLVGRTLQALDDDSVLVVMSDHGFKSFRRCVDLNRWLSDNGYLALTDPAAGSKTYLGGVDWSRTRAYALGLAGIFLNIKGRERSGIVEPGEAAALARQIADKLTGLKDPDTGEIAVQEARPRETVYKGPYVDAAPDLIVGYRDGHRVSWDSVIGKCGDAVFSDNKKAWSGDHCIHPDLVPGVLFCDRTLKADNAAIVDVAPTTLELLGVKRPAYMDGRSLL